MRKIEKNKGITIIALAITIIVLLILGGVTIKFITGDEGIIRKGKEASDSALNMESSTAGDRQNLLNEIYK